MRERGPLTEAMFYILMVLSARDVCGTEISEAVAAKTKGRVRLGPGTLYTILGKFLDEGFIQEVDVQGRRRTYQITESGQRAYADEVARLKQCIADAEEDV